MDTFFMVLGSLFQVPLPKPVEPAHIYPILLEVVGLLANLAVLATAVFVWWQVKVAIAQLTEARRDQRNARSLDYIRRWNEASDRPQKAEAYQACADDKKSKADKVKMLEGDAVMRALVKADLNFFEELGIADQHGLIAEDLVFAFYEGVVPYLWEHYGFWVEHQRAAVKDKNPEKLYEHFSGLNEKYLRKKKGLA